MKTIKTFLALSLRGEIALHPFQANNRDLNLNYSEPSPHDSCMSVLISYLLCTICDTHVVREDTIIPPIRQRKVTEVQHNDGCSVPLLW